MVLKPRGDSERGAVPTEMTTTKAFVAIIFVSFTGIRPSVSGLPLFHQPLELSKSDWSDLSGLLGWTPSRLGLVVLPAIHMDFSRCH